MVDLVIVMPFEKKRFKIDQWIFGYNLRKPFHILRHIYKSFNMKTKWHQRKDAIFVGKPQNMEIESNELHLNFSQLDSISQKNKNKSFEYSVLV
jgi:hypothetical protein